MRRLAAAALLAVALSSGCQGGPSDHNVDVGGCTDEARPDGTCLPPSWQTIQDWLDLGVPSAALQDCLHWHPDGNQKLQLCVLRYVKDKPRDP
jgi:hypothetical protein